MRPIRSTFVLLVLCVWQCYAAESSVSIKDFWKPLISNICACPTTTASCPQYDRQLLATDLVEAVRNFPDLTLPDPGDPWKYDESDLGEARRDGGAKSRQQHQYKCSGDRCRSCSRELVDRIYDAGFLNSEAAKKDMEAQLGIQQYDKVAKSSYCGRTQMRRGRNPYGKHGGKGKGKGSHESSHNAVGPGQVQPMPYVRPNVQRPVPRWRPSGTGIPVARREAGGKQKRRQKRQTTSDLGKRKVLFCIERGTPIEEGSAWLTLCNYCWAWRQLPDEYSPTYVNELVCNVDQSDSTCLSKHGKCQQVYRTVDVMKKRGRDVVTESIKVGTACSCQIKPDSQAFGLVTGKGFQIT